MPVHRLAAGLSSLLVLIILFASQLSASKPHGPANGLHTYVDIPGASRVGSNVCGSCHEATSKNFQHAFHKQQGVECEDCHGNGSLHVAAGGDVAKIIVFGKRSVSAADGVCLGCHVRDESVRHWSGGSHAANHVRCVDCHQVHETALTAANDTQIRVDTVARGALAADVVSPETGAILRPRSETNEACLKCHRTEGAQLSMPYHHPLREGKMSCVDCHDAHGGPGGNNLRTANVNQLCVSCHAQYRGPFAYQHPPVTEDCMNCHTAHGSPNTNLLSVSEPALCLQCHAGHHNGAGLPLVDRCTNCHGSIHGTDVATPSGGSRFVDKGPYGVPSEPAQSASFAAILSSRSTMSGSSIPRPSPSHVPTYPISVAGGALGMLSSGYRPPMSGGNMGDASNDPAADTGAYSAYSITPGAFRFVDQTGFGGRVGEYDSLQESAGADAVASYVSPYNHLTLVARAGVLSRDDYSAASQGTIGGRLQFGFDMRSFVQQQDHYPFYAGVMSSDLAPPDGSIDLIPSHASLAVTRRLGNAYVRLKLPKLPVHVFVKGSWQARAGVTQLAYFEENTTTTCGEMCHYTSQSQPVNYTTRSMSVGADADLGQVRLTWTHHYSRFTDHLPFPIGTYSGPFTPANEPPPPPVAVPGAFPAGSYYLDIPAPSRSSADSVSATWTASPTFSVNGHVSYTRLRDTFTGNPQHGFDSDDTLNWRPLNRLRVTADYHQQNVVNNFTPFYSLYGNVSYRNHSEGVKLDYELPNGFDIDAHYKRRDISRSNASLWPQAYSFNNTDVLMVVPSSFSNTTGLALRYQDQGSWSARTGYEWTGTHNPGYVIVPRSNNRTFADIWLTPTKWLIVSNDASIIVQNAFPVIQRSNSFYTDAFSATFRLVPDWNLGLGYSYQRNDLTTDMAFQHDSAAGYVLDEPAVPYQQVSQVYWAESAYTIKQRGGLVLRITHNSSRSGFRPDVNPNDAARLGNAVLMSQDAFNPVLFQQALGNLQLGATQVSQVIVPQWLGQSKVYCVLPHSFEGGLIVDYGSYRDVWNPNLNGVLRTFDVYVGRSW